MQLLTLSKETVLNNLKKDQVIIYKGDIDKFKILPRGNITYDFLSIVNSKEELIKIVKRIRKKMAPHMVVNDEKFLLIFKNLHKDLMNIKFYSELEELIKETNISIMIGE